MKKLLFTAMAFLFKAMTAQDENQESLTEIGGYLFAMKIEGDSRLGNVNFDINVSSYLPVIYSKILISTLWTLWSTAAAIGISSAMGCILIFPMNALYPGSGVLK